MSGQSVICYEGKAGQDVRPPDMKGGLWMGRFVDVHIGTLCGALEKLPLWLRAHAKNPIVHGLARSGLTRMVVFRCALCLTKKLFDFTALCLEMFCLPMGVTILNRFA